MPLYDDTSDDGYGEFVFQTTGELMHGYEYLERAADEATATILESALSAADEPEDISAEYAPVTWNDLPGNDSRYQLVGLLQDERVASIIESCGISPESFGRDFTYTRNGEGTGFWDRAGIPSDDANYLTDMAHAAGTAGAEFTRDENGDISYLIFSS